MIHSRFAGHAERLHSSNQSIGYTASLKEQRGTYIKFMWTYQRNKGDTAQEYESNKSRKSFSTCFGKRSGKYQMPRSISPTWNPATRKPNGEDPHGFLWSRCLPIGIILLNRLNTTLDVDVYMSFVRCYSEFYAFKF